MACRAAQSLRQVCGADPESGAHLSRIQPKQKSASTDWRQITRRWSRLSPFMPISSASPTGPGLVMELPRYLRVATSPRPALVPNIPRLCGFPGREGGFGAQRGFCRSAIFMVFRLWRAEAVVFRGRRSRISWTVIMGDRKARCLKVLATRWPRWPMLREVLFCAGRILETSLGLRTA